MIGREKGRKKNKILQISINGYIKWLHIYNSHKFFIIGLISFTCRDNKAICTSFTSCFYIA